MFHFDFFLSVDNVPLVDAVWVYMFECFFSIQQAKWYLWHSVLVHFGHRKDFRLD
jgi:hypothetical protein